MGSMLMAKRRREGTVRASPRMPVPMEEANRKSASEAVPPKQTAYNTARRKIGRTSPSLPSPMAAATSRVTARLMPEVAKVTAKP